MKRIFEPGSCKILSITEEDEIKFLVEITTPLETIYNSYIKVFDNKALKELLAIYEIREGPPFELLPQYMNDERMIELNIEGLTEKVYNKVIEYVEEVNNKEIQHNLN